MEEKIVSEKWSLKGWNTKDWFLGNWKTLKEILKVGVPLLVGLVSTDKVALIALITLAGKLVLDAGQYFYNVYVEE